ncbi:MAG: trehalase family glycosidase [Candidatus Firestonebacteria bacterium]
MAERKLPNIWGDGAYFTFSGYQGRTDVAFQVIGKLLADRIGMSVTIEELTGLTLTAEFWLEVPGVNLSGYLPERSVVAGEVIKIVFKQGYISFAAVDHLSLACFTNMKNAKLIVKPITPVKKETCGKNVFLLKNQDSSLAVAGKGLKRNKFYFPAFTFKDKFILTVNKKENPAKIAALKMLNNKILAGLPEKNLQALKRLLPKWASTNTAGKAVSILKANVLSAQGDFPCRWTTPDRIPHRSMWLWDSAFHSRAWEELDIQMSFETVNAVLSTQRKDGFIPIKSTPFSKNQLETQPPILAWQILSLYKKTKDMEILKNTYAKLEKFSGFFEKNRRDKKTKLFFWQADFKDTICRAGESGLDNSPLYDGEKVQLSCDLSSFMANAYESMAKISAFLGKPEVEQEAWKKKYAGTVAAINKYLWSGKDGFYFDREINGKFINIKAATGFFPLFAGAVPKKNLKKLLAHLVNKKEFWRPFPFPTIAADSCYYAKDMWRGPAWINCNYLIVEGLLRYNKKGLAKKIAALSEKTISYWYNKTGVICEYYDAENKEDPRYLPRKNYGGQGYLGVIRDYGWSAALYLMFLKMLKKG